MNQPDPTLQAHEDLRKLLFQGRILLNGLPLTGNELNIIIQGEHMLFEKATQLDRAIAAEKAKAPKAPKHPKKKLDALPIRPEINQPVNKE